MRPAARFRAGDRGVSHKKIADGAGVQQPVEDGCVTQSVIFTDREHCTGNHTGRTGGGCRYDESHGSVDLQHGHGIGDGFGKGHAAERGRAC